MLTRTPYTGGDPDASTQFEWDNWNLVREFAPDGVYRYYCPQGELLTFDFTPTGDPTQTYCVHSDALGSVRAITDSTGAVVAHFEYDAWGNLLASSDFGTLTGWPYQYVGSLGVRYDAASGMHYMRHRWYDPGLGRFVSREPLGTGVGQAVWGRDLVKIFPPEHLTNLYSYVQNAPLDYVDPMGLFKSGSKMPRITETKEGINPTPNRNDIPVPVPPSPTLHKPCSCFITCLFSEQAQEFFLPVSVGGGMLGASARILRFVTTRGAFLGSSAAIALLAIGAAAYCAYDCSTEEGVKRWCPPTETCDPSQKYENDL